MGPPNIDCHWGAGAVPKEAPICGKVTGLVPLDPAVAPLLAIQTEGSSSWGTFFAGIAGTPWGHKRSGVRCGSRDQELLLLDGGKKKESLRS